VGVELIARYKQKRGSWREGERGVGKEERNRMRELFRKGMPVKGV